MAYPVDLGTLNIYKGNPYNLTIVIEDEDYTNKTFRSQIRSNPTSDSILVEFTISDPVLVDGDTVFVMSLTGDPAIGENTGETRLIGSSGYFDVERIGPTGIPEETMFTGKLSATQDVTR